MTTTATTTDRLFEAVVKFQDALNRDHWMKGTGYAQTNDQGVLAEPLGVYLRRHAGRADSHSLNTTLHPAVDWALSTFVLRFGHDDRMYYRLGAQIDIANVRDDNSDALAVRLLNILTETYWHRAQIWRMSSPTNKDKE